MARKGTQRHGFAGWDGNGLEGWSGQEREAGMESFGAKRLGVVGSAGKE
tara:strand:+ start:102 stop:248 length:147 start_codon:yes stop_codon:yes gene_type:complete